jgi:hypothetical protein
MSSVFAEAWNVREMSLRRLRERVFAMASAKQRPELLDAAVSVAQRCRTPPHS